jgi:ABC-2 type transport system ATP-binding protein
LYQKEENIPLIDYYCTKFKLDKRKTLTKLSKGMHQKVLIIQSLIHDAKLYIFDEPLNGLDDYSQNIFFEIINNIKRNNKTLLITTHYPSLYGNKYDYYLKIENKRILYESN